MGLMQSTQFDVTGGRKRVAIAGFDVEGKATYEYLKSDPQLDITIIDQADIKVPEGVEVKTGDDVFDQELEYDEVWRTPGLAPSKLCTSGRVTSGTIEFFSQCPARIIGVTGSKGKGTTASLIAEIARRAGQTVHLVGNIGRPALSVLGNIQSNDLVVYELSSFQLWDLKASPNIAVVLMIEPDHLDVHKDMDDYISAKSNIVRWQAEGDTAIFLNGDEGSEKVAASGMGKKIGVPSDEGALIEDGILKIAGDEICQVQDFGLIGEHNHSNIMAGLTAAWQIAQDAEAAQHAIKSFKGLEHRLQKITNKQGVDYIDDSISTTPSSAIAALRAFDGPMLIILGGSDKGAKFSKLASEVAKQQASVVLIGQTSEQIAKELSAVGVKDYKKAEDMKQAVELASKVGQGGTVLLSPACASFDMFKDYVDRAQQFKLAVQEL